VKNLVSFLLFLVLSAVCFGQNCYQCHYRIPGNPDPAPSDPAPGNCTYCHGGDGNGNSNIMSNGPGATKATGTKPNDSHHTGLVFQKDYDKIARMMMTKKLVQVAQSKGGSIYQWMATGEIEIHVGPPTYVSYRVCYFRCDMNSDNCVKVTNVGCYWQGPAL